MKISEITEPPVQDPLVTQIGNCFEKFADAPGKHMTTLDNQICKNIIDAMNTSDNPRSEKEEGTENSLISLWLRPAKTMKSTAGITTKS